MFHFTSKGGYYLRAASDQVYTVYRINYNSVLSIEHYCLHA